MAAAGLEGEQGKVNIIQDVLRHYFRIQETWISYLTEPQASYVIVKRRKGKKR